MTDLADREDTLALADALRAVVRENGALRDVDVEGLARSIVASTPTFSDAVTTYIEFRLSVGVSGGGPLAQLKAHGLKQRLDQLI